MDKKKKVLAAISAVMTYIKTAEEAASMQAAAYNTACSVPFKLWGISSRLDMMQGRTLMQMKAFHKKS